MQMNLITTSFGRRTMSLGQVARQIDTAEAPKDQSYEKWKLFRLICEARPLIGVSDRALVVLEALLTFYPTDELAHESDDTTRLIVFPSNEKLSQRSHGMAPATLRRHLAALVECGLIIRNDSPNGKRFKRKGSYGQETVAYGFNLTPLLARAGEFENMAKHIRTEKAALRVVREELTLVRRDISKLIEMGLAEAITANWIGLQEDYAAINSSLSRTPELFELERALKEFHKLRQTIHKLLENCLKSENMSANHAQNERHIHNSKPQLHTESEPASETNQETKLEQERPILKQEVKSFPLGMVLQACPDIANYAPGGEIGSWRDLNVAASVVRSMLGISESAYHDACTAMGPDHASIVVACILQRHEKINSAGGYLRALTDKALDGKFSPGPMLMALVRDGLERQKPGRGAA